MAQVCPQCKAINDDDAIFCDQCSARLKAPSAESSKHLSRPTRINWIALVILAAVVAVIAWLVLSPSEPSTRNPHSTEDLSAMDSMTDIKVQNDQAREALKNDPLDTDALLVLYRNFGLINQPDTVRPYLDEAISALETREAELGEHLEHVALSLAYAALSGGDLEGGISALSKLVELRPDNPRPVKLVADVYYEYGDDENAISWYSDYLNQTSPEQQGQDYWDARVDRAVVYMRSSANAPDSSRLQLAIDELTAVTDAQPEFWNAWYNLGQAYFSAGDDELAAQAWRRCTGLAADDIQRKHAEEALANLQPDGVKPPANESAAGGL